LANADIVFTLHYTPTGKDAVDVARVGFTVAKERPQRRVLTYPLSSPTDADSFAIPPHAGNWQSPPVMATFEQEAELFWMMPHMHLRGKDMTYRLTYPDGRSEVALHVPKYDFNWQLGYYPSTPIKLPKGTKLRVDAHFDNSTLNKFNPNPNQTVYYGDMTWEEMMGPFLSITVDMNVDPKTVLTRQSGTDSGGG
jgi:peptidoglycan hydrolase-like protein with peptidoglycan-binding domain